MTAAHPDKIHPDNVYRVVPTSPTGVGVLALRGSSGTIDRPRVDLLARHGALAEGMRWFGGPGQQPGPYEIPLESFAARVAALRADCDRVVVIGTSFGAEAALATAALLPGIDAVVAFAPSDVIWAGVRPDETQTSHWSLGGEPLPYVEFVDDWRPETDPPAYRGLYAASRTASPHVVEATVPVERIGELMLVAGGDDQVWPSVDQAMRIVARRSEHGRSTTVVTLAAAGHYCTLPGEPPTAPGMVMARGGSDAAAAELGRLAWPPLLRLLTPGR